MADYTNGKNFWRFTFGDKVSFIHGVGVHVVTVLCYYAAITGKEYFPNEKVYYFVLVALAVPISLTYIMGYRGWRLAKKGIAK